MYGAAKPANYYLPAQRDEETPPPLKKKKQYESVSRPPRATRILGRRYALTATAFKYLEIGISVGPVSTVDLIIGDNRGAQILLPNAMWKTLMEKRSDIQRLLDDSTSSSPLWIRDLAVEVYVISNIKMFKLTLSNSFLYLKPTTMQNLFNLEHCIDHMYGWLMENTYLVNTKFQNFVSVLREKNIIGICSATKAIRESEMYDCESLVDCELLACALNNIMYDASQE